MNAPRVGLKIADKPNDKGGTIMGAKTDQMLGRAKQSIGAIAGDEELKAKGQAQEDEGKVKGKVDSVVDKAQDSLEGVKRAVKRK